jgi:hypothetical protein
LTHLPENHLQNIHEVHAELHVEQPVCMTWIPGGLSVWLVTGYHDAKIALTDPRISKNISEGRRLFERHGPTSYVADAFSETMLNVDPCDQPGTRYERSATSSGFAARVGDH